VDFEEAIREHESMMAEIGGVWPALERAASEIVDRSRRGGAVYFFGNGGSATQALHFAGELVGRFERERRGIAAFALVADTSLITAIANDYSFDMIFARQVEALCGPNDVAVGLSTSGNSANVLAAVDVASARGAVTVAMTGGDGGKLAARADIPIVVPNARTCRIQEAHLFLGHALCELVEEALSGEDSDVRPA
jgi:D-sedoheptulose 7-phosphate isomerase